MPFYRVTQKPEALAIRLSLKREKPYYPKWVVEGQDKERFVAIQFYVPFNTLGLYLGKSKITHGSENWIDAKILLIGETQLYVPSDCVRSVSEQELEKMLNEQTKTT